MVLNPPEPEKKGPGGPPGAPGGPSVVLVMVVVSSHRLGIFATASWFRRPWVLCTYTSSALCKAGYPTHTEESYYPVSADCRDALLEASASDPCLLPGALAYLARKKGNSFMKAS